jgi:hypothetical protein
LSSSNKDNIDEETLGAGNDNESKTKQESNDKMNNAKMDEHVDHKTVVNETIKDRGERKPENKNKNSEKEGNVGNDRIVTACPSPLLFNCTPILLSCSVSISVSCPTL